MRKAIFASLFFAAVIGFASARYVMPWFCLERCGEHIDADLDQLMDHLDLLNPISYERFNLGSKGELVINDLTDITKRLLSVNRDTYAMVSTYPQGPHVIDYCRELFANPEPFIEAVVNRTIKEGITGVNIDMEPLSATHDDAVDFANFINELSLAMHAVGAKVSVDVASWGSMWDFGLLGQTAVDKIITMDTYCSNLETFESRVKKIRQHVPAEKIVFGLMTTNPNTGKPYTDAEVAERFALFEELNLQSVAVWQMPVPENWFPYLYKL